MHDLLSAIDTAVTWIVSILYFVQGYLLCRILCCMVRRRSGKLWGAAILFPAPLSPAWSSFPMTFLM